MTIVASNKNRGRFAAFEKEKDETADVSLIAEETNEWLEDLGGKFRAKLREVSTQSRQSTDGKTMTTFKLGKVEAGYDPDVVQKLAPGQLIAIPNVKTLKQNTSYSVFEIADIIPMHYSMLSLSTNQPGALRGEFMGLIEKEWKQNSKSTWIEIVASPTGYIGDFLPGEIKYERRYSPLLVGSAVLLLNKEAVRRFVCYVPELRISSILTPEAFNIGNLLGVIEDKVPFTINFEQLINYHVGVFCHTGGGKSYLTSMIVRKALKAVDELKVVIFDVSAEYAVHLLDELASSGGRIISAKRGTKKPDLNTAANASDFYNRHVKPEALESREKDLKSLIEDVFKQQIPRTMFVAPNYLSGIAFYRSYEGLLESLEQTASEKYNSNQQASIYVIDRIRAFLHDANKDESDAVDKEILPLLSEIQLYFASAGVKQNSTLYGLIKGLQERLKQDIGEPEDVGYSLDSLVSEILDDSKDSPKLFVVDEEIETSREIATKVIEEIFRRRRGSFKLRPRILFVFDEAQEFVPGGDTYKSSGEGLGECSKAVEKLLRHGRKYHLHGWISTQRLAYLNTNALHQLHSYFVGTLPRPYDRQLVGDTFAIDDALLERTLNFAPGDWLLASYRGTNTQNVPVFFHAINNEEFILPNQ